VGCCEKPRVSLTRVLTGSGGPAPSSHQASRSELCAGGVVEHGGVDDLGEVALQAAARFCGAFAFGPLSFEIRARLRVQRPWTIEEQSRATCHAESARGDLRPAHVRFFQGGAFRCRRLEQGRVSEAPATNTFRLPRTLTRWGVRQRRGVTRRVASSIAGWASPAVFARWNTALCPGDSRVRAIEP